MALRGASVYIFGIEGSEKRELTALIKSGGGNVSTILGVKTTHLITTPEKIAERAYSVKKALENKSHVVSADWVKHSVEARQMLDEGKYTLSDDLDKVKEENSYTQSFVSQKVLPTGSVVPTVNLVIPPAGKQNGLELAIFGRNFNPSGKDVHVKIGTIEIDQGIDVHSSTALVVKVPNFPKLSSGSVLLQISNDNGVTWGPGANFSFVSMEGGSDQHSEISDSRNFSSREVKIFLSSPFKDMQSERDWIVKWGIPKLRKLCSERNVVLSYVDLRWGVTDVQSAKATSLLMCLRELHRANIFVGSLSERYGWALSKEPLQEESNELLGRNFDMASKEFSWITKYKDRSITEVEMRAIIDGIIKIPCYFYLRDPKYIDTIPVYDRRNYLSENSDEKSRLQKLKSDIRENFPKLTQEYSNPKEMAEKMVEQISQFIEKKFQISEIPNSVEGETANHENFIRSWSRIYLPNPKYFFTLDKHVADASVPLVITGLPGVGKSALLANWVSKFREHHPEDLVISHFIGCSSSSTNYANMLSRVMEGIRNHVGKAALPDMAIPKSGNILIQEFPLWLAKAVTVKGGRRVVLIIDGLDKLDDCDNALDLLWLPRSFPENLRLILSTNSGRPMLAISKRSHKILSVEKLHEWERVSFIRTYLNWHSKKLSEKQEFRMAQAEQLSNPLFGKVLMDDICAFGDFDHLDERISTNLSASTARDLYSIVIRRLVDDYDKNHTGVVEGFLCAIWASRKGLTEEELESIMAAQGHSVSEWHPVFLALEGNLYNCSSLWNFSDKEFQHAVEDSFLTTKKKKNFAHENLVNFFTLMKDNFQRKVEELPWQISHLGDPRRLREILNDLEIFQALYQHSENKFLLIGWWKELEKSNFDVVKEYNDVLDFYEKDRYYNAGPEGISHVPYFLVGYFLEEIAKYFGAEKIYHRALKWVRDPKDKATVMNAIARLYETQARYELAEKILQDALSINQSTFGENHVETSHTLTRLGAVYIHNGNLNEAENALRKSLKIRENSLGPSHSRVGQTLKHLLAVYEARGDYSTAEEHGLRALKITEESCGPFDFHVSSILLKIGVLYTQLHRHQKCEEFFNRALEIRRMKFGDDHPFTADVLREIATVYEQQGKLDEAEPYYKRALEIKIKSLGEEHPEISIIQNRLAAVYTRKNRLDEAEKLLVTALKTRVKILGENHSRVGQTLKHMLTLYELKGDFKKAAECGYKALQNTKVAFGEDHFHISGILLRLGILQISLNQYEQARASLDRAMEIRVKKFGPNHPYVGDVLHEIGKMKIKLLEFQPAREALEKALQIREKESGPDSAPYKETKELLKVVGNV